MVRNHLLHRYTIEWNTEAKQSIGEFVVAAEYQSFLQRGSTIKIHKYSLHCDKWSNYYWCIQIDITQNHYEISTGF